MTASTAVLVQELLETLATDGTTRSRLMGLRPDATTDLAELATKGRQTCPSCAARLRAVVKELSTDDLQVVFRRQARVVDPKPLATPRVLTLDHAGQLQEALDRLVVEEEVLIRSVSTLQHEGRLCVVVV